MSPSRTRSGVQYRESYAPDGDLIPDASGSNALPTDAQIVTLVRPRMAALAAHPRVDTTNYNIATLLAKFHGYAIHQQDSYANSSALSEDDRSRYDLAPTTTGFTGPLSEQTNDQHRNHTEPKLLQEFSDRFLASSVGLLPLLRWVVLVTDRPACTTCVNGSILPFAAKARRLGFGFHVLDLGGGILNNVWNVRHSTLVLHRS